jgi:hypothetical protein
MLINCVACDELFEPDNHHIRLCDFCETLSEVLAEEEAREREKEQKSMTDRNQIIDQIEELLGSEGSAELALAMFGLLREHGYVTFDPEAGFVLDIPDFNDGGRHWNTLLIEADGAIGIGRAG